MSTSEDKYFFRPEDLEQADDSAADSGTDSKDRSHSFNWKEKLGQPGGYPFTRGIYPDMYRSRNWTMRQYAGFGNADETNKRFRYLLANGQTGLSTAFDLPTQMGLDSDDPMALGEVGRTGVAIDTLADMERLFDQIDLGKVSTSMTINATSAILLAMYQEVGARQGVPSTQLAGTIQNDILKEYEARNTYIFPPKGSMRLITDIFRYCSTAMPKWNTISISGYHIREAGATAVQELAFTFANAIEYVRAAMAAGLEVDTFAPQLSFFFVAQMNLFEEIAKFRAARRIWAKIMKERFGAKNPKSMNLRFHVQTAGSSLTLQQPDNNIVRTTLEALAAALGGCQSLHTNSKDEAIALPTEASALTALRTQQIIAFETGVTSVVDPVGGSYYIENLTDQVEAAVLQYLERIEAMGGAIKAVEAGFIQKEIQDAAYEDHQEKDSKRRLVVGVNSFTDGPAGGDANLGQGQDEKIQVQRIDPDLEPRQVAALNRIKQERDNEAVAKALADLHSAAEGSDNLMPYILAAVQKYATVGEISGTLKRSFGKFRPLVTI